MADDDERSPRRSRWRVRVAVALLVGLIVVGGYAILRTSRLEDGRLMTEAIADFVGLDLTLEDADTIHWEHWHLRVDLASLGGEITHRMQQGDGSSRKHLDQAEVHAEIVTNVVENMRRAVIQGDDETARALRDEARKQMRKARRLCDLARMAMEGEQPGG